MIFYIASTNKLLELINEFGKLSRYKNQLYFYSPAKNNQYEIKKTIYKGIKKVQHLGINFTKEVQNMYTENYKTVERIKEGLNKWKATQFTDLNT